MFEPVLAPGTHIGIRENGDVKKPSHTGTRKHARFTPIMKVRTTHNTQHTYMIHTTHTRTVFMRAYYLYIYTCSQKHNMCNNRTVAGKEAIHFLCISTGYQFGWREPSIGMYSIVYFVDLLP